MVRGRDHRSPLEIIALGDIEQLMLTQQGYTPDDILPEGKKVNLRRNSNISTGGDSIDITETMDSSYQELGFRFDLWQLLEKVCLGFLEW